LVGSSASYVLGPGFKSVNRDLALWLWFTVVPLLPPSTSFQVQLYCSFSPSSFHILPNSSFTVLSPIPPFTSSPVHSLLYFLQFLLSHPSQFIVYCTSSNTSFHILPSSLFTVLSPIPPSTSFPIHRLLYFLQFLLSHPSQFIVYCTFSNSSFHILPSS